MDLWFEWREENNDERFSFEDSDRFEEDSLVSWNSEPESICANWRGWKHISQSQNGANLVLDKYEQVDSLIEICAKTVAKTIPFEAVEHSYPQIPEQIQLRIAFWSFPLVEDDIRLYSCLANGSPDEFQRGEHLVRAKAVRDALQIGFHLSATVNQQHSSVQTKGMFSVAVTFDRGHVTSCNCTCSQSATWCAHIIALCLFRIYHPDQVCLRAPVSEYLSRLRRDQLQKFAQYLISELPQQLLPTAQRLLDELLSSQESEINTLCGAPDPTAGPAATDHNRWCMDEKGLRDNVRKMLTRFCGPVPLVFSDASAVYMSNTAPPTAAEWSNLLRPLKGREPEGMWNLLYIVRELFHRRDSNSIKLLSTLSEECLANDQVVIWWFDSRSQASGSSVRRNHGNGYRNNTNAASTEATKHACAGFCDELVVLWRLAALNPKLSNEERQDLKVWLEQWHQVAVDKARAGHGAGFQAAVACFPGFHPAIEACSLTWGNIDLSSDSEKTEDLANYNSLSVNLNDNPKQDDDMQTRIESENKEFPLVDLLDTDENLEVLCARAEALHVHGYSTKASKLAVQLAEKILDSKTQGDTNSTVSSNKQLKSSSYSGTTLVKAAFLCGVLAEDPLCHHLAFKVGMFGLEMPRQPAKSKALEVKLAHQESELTALLRKLPLRGEEMMVVREKANLICQGKLHRGAVLPIMLATFIFEVLCCPGKASKETNNDQQRKMDEDIGYMAAFCALGMRPSILESCYPILCEGIRRQRGDLAIAMLDYCKDNSTRLKAVKEVLLDKTRYEGPGFVNEVERQSDPRDNNKKKIDDNSTRNRGLGLSPRRGSSSQSSSYTSDSGTDSGSRGSSGNNRGKTRQANNKVQSRPFNVPTTEDRREDESGSSSGVDTDSAVNHPSPSVNHPSSNTNHPSSIVDLPSPNVSAKVVGICKIPRNATDSCRWSIGSAQGTSGTRSSPRGTESRGSKAKGNASKVSRDGATSDLEGSDVDGGNDDGIVLGGVSLSPSSNVTVKVHEITLPMHNAAARDARKYSSSSNEHIDNLQGRDNVVESVNTPRNDVKLEHHSKDVDGDFRVSINQDIATDNSRGNLNDSASSVEQDLELKRRESLSDSSGNISPVSSSSSSNVSSSGFHTFDAPKGISKGKKKGTCVTFKTEGLPGPPKETQPNASRSIVAQQNSQSNEVHHNAEAFSHATRQERSHETRQVLSNAAKVCNSEIKSHDEVLKSNDQTSGSCDKKADSDYKDNTRSEVDDQKDFGVGALSLGDGNAEQNQATSVEASGRQEKEEVTTSATASGGTEKDTEEDQSAQACGWTEGGGGADDASVDESGWVVGGGIDPGVAETQAGSNVNAENNRVSPARQRRGNKKNRRGNKKKGKNSAINQATEAEAHFMFELAKTVLTRAGGNSNTSVFSTPATSSSHTGPHRGLQLCAFELGLFALGLHNRTSVNWLSRTYSSHVSWISGQAMEIGSTAIQLLIERWEGNLTPSEVASISDRASRSNDPTMVRAAAELGLSCLHMAHTLNPGEIQRALLQCRDEDTQLLDRACHAVESAARGGGVYPEVLFDVARHWHHLHEQSQASSSRQQKENSRRGSQSSRSQPQPAASTSSPSGNPFVHPSPLESLTSFSALPPPPYQTAEQYVQTQMHQQVQHLMNPSSYNGSSTYRATSQPNYGFGTRQLHSNQFQISGPYGGVPPPYQSSSPSVCQLSSRTLGTQSGGQVSYYLNNAYRVGMLALESLARRTPDDRPTVKYSRNPPCSDDIRWLCSLSARLGTSYLHRFCVSALNAVVSPFVLHEIALEAARHLARSNPAQLAVNLRSPNISPLVQKSLSMYGQCIHHNLMIMTQSDHEEFVELLRHARGAFCMVPGGMSQFNELLQSIRRLYPKKKDLWQKIMTGLAKA